MEIVRREATTTTGAELSQALHKVKVAITIIAVAARAVTIITAVATIVHKVEEELTAKDLVLKLPSRSRRSIEANRTDVVRAWRNTEKNPSMTEVKI